MTFNNIEIDVHDLFYAYVYTKPLICVKDMLRQTFCDRISLL